MREYLAEHGECPADLLLLLAAADLPTHVLKCPSDDGEPAESGEPLVYGVTVSYVTLNDALVNSGNPDVVVAVESPAVHGDGATVLYADGVARFLPSKDVAELVRKLIQDGRWPFLIDASQFRPTGTRRDGANPMQP